MLSTKTKNILFIAGAVFIGSLLGFIVYLIINHFRKNSTGNDSQPTVCNPDCGKNTCGLDPLCKTKNCGSCATGETCQNGSCVSPTPPPENCTSSGGDMYNNKAGKCLPCCKGSQGYLMKIGTKYPWKCYDKTPPDSDYVHNAKAPC